MDYYKKLISTCIPKDLYQGEDKITDAQCLSNFNKLSTMIEENDLRNVDYIIFKAVRYFSEVEGVLSKPILFDYLQSYIDILMRSDKVKVNEIITDSGHQYDLDLEGDFEVAKKELFSIVGEYYDILTEMEIKQSEFNSLMKIYSEELYNLNYNELLKKCAIIANKGLEEWQQGRMVMLRGGKDADEYYQHRIIAIKSKFTFKEREFINTAGDVSQIQKTKQFQEAMFDIISDTGIKPIDDAFLKFRRTQMLGIEAGAGVGKSRLARWISFRSLYYYKKNVLDITMEQQYTEIWAMYISTLLFVKYNQYIPDSIIVKNEVPEELQHLVNIAEYDLFTNKEHGRLMIEARDMYIEECFEVLTDIYKTELKYDCLVFDYVSLVDSKDTKSRGAVNSYEVVTAVYKRLKRDICRKLKVFVIAINQLTKEGVKALAKGEKSSTYDGSNSGETYKSTDFNLVISSNEQLDAEGKIRITSPKFRSGEKFYNVYASARLGCSVFSYDDETETITDEELAEQLSTQLI